MLKMLFVCGLIASSSLRIVCADDIPINAESLDEIARIESANAFESLREKQIRSTSTEDLRGMIVSESDQISVLASWELVERLNDTQTVSSDARPSRDWFVGLLEGRLQVSVPERWKSHLSSGFEDSSESLAALYTIHNDLANGGKLFVISRGFDCQEADGASLRLSRDGNQLVEHMFSTFGIHNLVLTVMEANDVLCVLSKNGLLNCYETLSFFERSENGEYELLWEAQIWMKDAMLFSHNPPDLEWEVIQMHRDAVYVYSGREDYAALHVFDGATGTPKLRFTTGRFR